MTSDYASMRRTAVQVQAAMIVTCLDLTARTLRLAATEALTLAEVAAQPWRLPAAQRQTAVEDAMRTFYVAHVQFLRGLSGAPALALMVFLNQLDLRRGERPAPGSAAGSTGQPD